VRWHGDLVGKLVAGDDTLRPRLRIVADEHLTGPARELVQTRLDLWLKTHIEKLLAPLFSLTAADDITGMARGVAFQLVEALGVLERQKVSEEVKGLEQPARATLRKYGVRFGAYHIYLPILLKPAPRSLATQLWALKHESPDAKGVDDLLHLAASGRTSIPVNKETPKALYRTAGYRICGERAVRVDILERLADLIRPALSWREGAPGAKPDGAFDGRSFTVTGAMTSLTGASGEDFASVLRALGYRMDRKPKPAEPSETKPAAPPVIAEAATPAEAQPVTEAAAPTAEAVAPAGEIATTPESSLALLPDAELMEPAGEAPPAAAATAEPVAEALAQAPVPAASETAPTPAAEAPATAEAAFIEVWRPAGRADRKPHRARRPHRAKPEAQPAAAPAVAGEATAAAAPVTEAPAEGATPAGEPAERPRRHERVERQDRQARRERHERQQRQERQDRRGERQEARGERPRRRRDDGPGRAEREQYYAKPYGSGGDRRKEPDPNSPFAKLAALKQQLEQKESS
jgi:ATP-dependent RNA helicase SUPV3L1/SUV3